MLFRRSERVIERPRRRAAGAFRPTLQAFEDRLLLAAFTWTGAVDTSWSDPGNWAENGVPGAADLALFDGTAVDLSSRVDAAYAGTLGALHVTSPDVLITLERSLTVADLQLEQGKIDGEFELTIGSGDWTGGRVETSKFIVSLSGLLTIGGDELKILGGTFENHGTTRWTGGNVLNNLGSTIVNNKSTGIFEADDHAQWMQEGDNAGFFNEGVFRKVGDDGTTTFDIAFYGLKTASADIEVGTLHMAGNGKHVGAMDIAAGAEVLCSAGYLLDGITITGDGFFHIVGDEQVLVANGVNIDNLQMDDGELGYLGAIFVHENFHWNGGNLVGKTEMTPGSTMVISGDGPKAVKYGSPINNFGLTVWEESSPIELGGVWTNEPRSTFEVHGSGLMYSLGNGSFVNRGTFRKIAAGSNGTTTMQTQFINTGVVAASAGTLELYRGESNPTLNHFRIAAGATIDLVDFTLNKTTVFGAGALRITGAGVVTLKDQVKIKNLEQVDGALLLNEGSLLIKGRMTWIRGFITGLPPHQVEIAPGAELHIVGHEGRVLSANIVSFGNTYWTGTGTVTVTNSRSFTNKPGAIFEIQNSAAMTSAGTLRNEGLLRRNEPNGTPTRIDTTLINTGTIEVLSGTISMGKAFSNAGTLLIGAGCTFSTDQTYTQTAGGSVVLEDGTLVAKGGLTIQTGAVSGAGTVQGNVLSSGTFVPGGVGGIGILEIVGNYSQVGAGTLLIDIEGTGAGIGFDQLQVTGTATLGGSLDVTLLNGYQPEPESVFEVTTFASSSGTFASVSGDGGVFDVVYNPDNVSLVTKSGRSRMERFSSLRQSTFAYAWNNWAR